MGHGRNHAENDIIPHPNGCGNSEELDFVYSVAEDQNQHLGFFFHVILAIRFAKILNEDPQVVTLLPDAIKCTRFLPEWVEEKIKGQPMFWVGFL